MDLLSRIVVASILVGLYLLIGFFYHNPNITIWRNVSGFWPVIITLGFSFFTSWLIFAKQEMQTLFAFLSIIFFIFLFLVIVDLEFFGIIILLVYAGVISILVLFIVMSSGYPKSIFPKVNINQIIFQWSEWYIWLYFCFINFFFICILYLSASLTSLPSMKLLFSIGGANFFILLSPLYSEYILILLVIAVALLTALIGALIITASTRGKKLIKKLMSKQVIPYSVYFFISKINCLCVPSFPSLTSIRISLKVLNKYESKHVLILFYFLTGRFPLFLLQKTKKQNFIPFLYGFTTTFTSLKTINCFLLKYLRVFLTVQNEIVATSKITTSTTGVIFAYCNSYYELDIITLDGNIDKNILFGNSRLQIHGSVNIPEFSSIISTKELSRIILQQLKIPFINIKNVRA